MELDLIITEKDVLYKTYSPLEYDCELESLLITARVSAHHGKTGLENIQIRIVSLEATLYDSESNLSIDVGNYQVINETCVKGVDLTISELEVDMFEETITVS